MQGFQAIQPFVVVCLALAAGLDGDVNLVLLRERTAPSSRMLYHWRFARRRPALEPEYAGALNRTHGSPTSLGMDRSFGA
jgi:hypothetical protein